MRIIYNLILFYLLNQNKMSDIPTFVVELCQDCANHGWNTRHDEAKYQEYFSRVAQAIIERMPNAMVMKNQIPKSYVDFELYNNLIPNNDE